VVGRASADGPLPHRARGPAHDRRSQLGRAGSDAARGDRARGRSGASH
jgi:hypothetical protein